MAFCAQNDYLLFLQIEWNKDVDEPIACVCALRPKVERIGLPNRQAAIIEEVML